VPECSLLRALKNNTPPEPFACTRRFANQLKFPQKSHERKTRAKLKVAAAEMIYRAFSGSLLDREAIKHVGDTA